MKVEVSNTKQLMIFTAIVSSQEAIQYFADFGIIYAGMTMTIPDFDLDLLFNLRYSWTKFYVLFFEKYKLEPNSIQQSR